MKRFLPMSFAVFGLWLFSCSSTPEQVAGGQGDVPAEAAGQAGSGATPGDSPAAEAPAEPAPVPVSAPGEVVNDVLYIVGEIPITSYDLENMLAELSQVKPVGGARRTKARLEKEAVDTLIMRAILDREAREETIIVSEARVDHEIQKRREAAGLNDEKKFRAEVEKQTGMPFDVWKKNLRYQLIRRQLIQIKLSVPPPGPDEVEKFYKKNQQKLGQELRFREIILQPANGSMEEEQRISNLARSVWREVKDDPAAFGRVARDLSGNVSRRRFAGGLWDYMPIHEIAERDRLLAGALYGMRAGEVSQVFRNRRNQYFIVKLEGKRTVPLAKVEEGIRQQLYMEKEQSVFEDWIEERKKAIKITKVK